MDKKVIIITGASSGIGYELAKHLSSDGHHVIGASRTFPKEAIDFDYKICDVSSEASMVELYKSIARDHKHIDVLINCAGYGIGGAIEDTSYHIAMKLHQINVLGPFLLTQLFLPMLKKSKQGRIVNIGSVAGEITIPFQAFYTMSKASLQKFTEALRMELKPFNVQVTNILPGDTNTNFGTNRQFQMEENSLYKDRVTRSLNKMTQDENHGMKPYSVVKVVRKQLKKRRMKPFVTVGFKYKGAMLLSRLLPAKLKERIIYTLYGK